MKFTKFLWMFPLLALLTASVLGCNKENLDSGYSGVAPENLTYDESNSDATSIAVYWDGTKALAAGATSYTVQLTKAVGDNAEASASSVVSTDDNSYVFSGLTEEDRYYVRIRAQYPMSVMSEWVYLLNTEDGDYAVAGEPAVVMVGSGIYDGPIADIAESLTQQEVLVNASEIGVRWSITDFADASTDIGDGYEFALYKDEACTDLFVKWSVYANADIFAGYSYYQQPLFPSFKFTGLDPETTYWVKIVSTSRDGYESVESYTTTASQVVDRMSDTSVSVGDIVLYEDFSELVWGGDMVAVLPGHSANQRGNVSQWEPATGDDPTNDATYGFYLTEPWLEMGMFSTLRLGIPNSRFATWGFISENTSTPGTVTARAGHLKLGASSLYGHIVTPAFDFIDASETASVTLTFNAGVYRDSSDDPYTFTVQVIDSPVLSDGSNYVQHVSGTISQTIDLNFDFSVYWEWESFSVNISGIRRGSRISIGGDTDGTGQRRLYLDNICITYTGSGEATAPDTPTGLALSVDENTITATWNASGGADSHSLRYKKSSDSEWTEVAGLTTSYTAEGLEELTQYDFQVKAVSTLGDSEWSDTVSATTESVVVIENVYANLINATAAELIIEWSVSNFEDTDLDRSRSYVIALYNDASCSDLVVQWNIDGGDAVYTDPSWATLPLSMIFSGLSPSTTYYFKARDVKSGVESSVYSYTTQASEVVTISSGTASAGDVLLFEDFSELVWGGNNIYLSAGYSSANRTSATSLTPAYGEDPTANEEFAFYLVSYSTEMVVFSTLQYAIPYTRLDTWGWMAEEGGSASQVCTQAGHIKLGASSLYGHIVTPELSNLSGNATIKVEFDVAPYRASTIDPTAGLVNVITGSSIASNHEVTGTVAQSQDFYFSTDVEWQHQEITLSGVAPNSRIAIGGYRASVSGQLRLYLDNVKVTLVQYE